MGQILIKSADLPAIGYSNYMQVPYFKNSGFECVKNATVDEAGNDVAAEYLFAFPRPSQWQPIGKDNLRCVIMYANEEKDGFQTFPRCYNSTALEFMPKEDTIM